MNFRHLIAIALLFAATISASVSNACMRTSPLEPDEIVKLKGEITKKLIERAVQNGKEIKMVDIVFESTDGGAEGDCGAIFGRGTASVTNMDSVETLAVSVFLSQRLGNNISIDIPRPKARPGTELQE